MPQNPNPDSMPRLINGHHDFLDGKFDRPFIADALNAAYQRYNGTGDVEGALIWLAAIFCGVKPDADALAWAKGVMDSIANGPS